MIKFYITLNQVTPGGHKKKIIAVGSDFESSPSPEETPSPPTFSRKSQGLEYNRDEGGDERDNFGATINQTPIGKPASKSQSFNTGVKLDELEDETQDSSERLTLSARHKKLVGSKWKNSISKFPESI